MTNPSVLLLRITAAIIILVAIAGTALMIKRQRDRERDMQDDHPKYRGSTLDAPPAEHNRKTSRLNPGIFGGSKNSTPPKPRSKAPELIVPLTIMAPNNRPFSGKTIARLVQAFGLQYSPNQTYELIGAGGHEIFCTMLDVRRPGIFPQNLDNAEHNYEGLMLVLQLPVSQEPVKDWETFSALAHEMAEHCDGCLSDHKRRPLEERSLARYRKNIEAYETQYQNWLRLQRG